MARRQPDGALFYRDAGAFVVLAHRVARAERQRLAMHGVDQEGAVRSSRFLGRTDEYFTLYQLQQALAAGVTDVDGAAAIERDLRAVWQGDIAALAGGCRGIGQQGLRRLRAGAQPAGQADGG